MKLLNTNLHFKTAAKSKINPHPQKRAMTKPSQQDHQGYTIQLMASRNRMDLVYFIRQHKLPAKANIYRTLRRGRPWYVLSMGNYRTKDDARYMVQKLSKQALAYGPWIRATHELNLMG